MANDNPYHLRHTSAKDGTEVWKLIRRAGTLDVNSVYCYLLLCDMFSSTCVIAEKGGHIAGFLSAFVKPDQSDTLFVWQVAVDPEERGKGLGKAMLKELLNRPRSSPIVYMEATVSLSNEASNRLFQSIADERGVILSAVDGGYPADLFPSENHHEGEPLIRIGPFQGRQ